jgi:hypothetical protein
MLIRLFFLPVEPASIRSRSQDLRDGLFAEGRIIRIAGDQLSGRAV